MKHEHDSAVFFYYSKSANKPPGKGANEFLASHDPSDFLELSKIEDWRKILSNFHEGVFEYEGRHYNTAEHCFQGAKISLVDESKGDLFAVESNSQLSLGNGEVARKNRIMVILNLAQLIEWNNKKDQVLEGILRAKFNQVEVAKRVLLLTKDAELWHGTRGIPKTQQLALERIRSELQSNLSFESDDPENARSELVSRKKLKRIR